MSACAASCSGPVPQHLPEATARRSHRAAVCTGHGSRAPIALVEHRRVAAHTCRTHPYGGRPEWRAHENVRRTAAGVLEAEQQFRRVSCHTDLPKLAIAVENEVPPSAPLTASPTHPDHGGPRSPQRRLRASPTDCRQEGSSTRSGTSSGCSRRPEYRSDPIDAEMAARQALSGHATVVPKLTDGIVEAMRQHLSAPKATRGKTTLCARLRPDLSRLHEPAQAARLPLRSLAHRVAELDREIAALDERLIPLVATAAPRTTQLIAVSTGDAGQLLVTAGRTSSAYARRWIRRTNAGPARRRRRAGT